MKTIVNHHTEFYSIVPVNISQFIVILSNFTASLAKLDPVPDAIGLAP